MPNVDKVQAGYTVQPLSTYLGRPAPTAAPAIDWPKPTLAARPEGPMFVVMRFYWPTTEAPSALPPGEGTWAPPGIVPVSNACALDVTRFGDKSLETLVRTDQHYGSDPFFQGPRGPYWSKLEYPTPIQNPNLWPDTQNTVFYSRFAMQAGSTLTLRGAFPRARYFSLRLQGGTWNFVSTGEDIAG